MYDKSQHIKLQLSKTKSNHTYTNKNNALNKTDEVNTSNIPYSLGLNYEKILHTRLHLGLCVLNKHLYSYNLCLSKFCDHCDGNKIEDAEHYLLKCSRYTTPRITLLLNVKLIICPDINITLLRDLCPTLAIMICFSYKLRVHLNFSYSYLIIIHNDHQREREREICLVLYYNIVLSFLFINLHYFALFTMLLYLSMLRRANNSLWLYVILMKWKKKLNIKSNDTLLVWCPTKDFCEFALTKLHTPVWYIVGMRRTSRIEIKMLSLCIVVTFFFKLGSKVKI